MQIIKKGEGKGLYIKNADFSAHYVLPHPDKFKNYISDEKIALYKDLSPFEFASFLGIPDEKLIFMGYMHKDKSLAEEKIKKLFGDEFYLNNTAEYIINSYHLLFEIEHDYPKNSFRSCCDMTDDIMIFLIEKFPLKNYEPNLQMLTEDTLLNQLKDFLYRVANDDLYLSKNHLEKCIEYGKNFDEESSLERWRRKFKEL